jgi:hypothetical protein
VNNLVMAIDKARQKPFLGLASMFEPLDVNGFSKIRMGSRFDGGYVMLDDFRNVDLALSFGIGANADWDLAVAQRGVTVRQYDHTITHSPISHDSIAFFGEKVTENPADASRTTIHSILGQAGTQRDASVILKMDVESDEWPIFDHCALEDLRRFSQIIVEFHEFSRGIEDDWLRTATRVLEKLTAVFGVFHVHGNNWRSMAAVGNVYFPEVLEVSFANRNRYSFAKTAQLFPTPLDGPNDPRRPDLYLGAFRFAPVEG